MEKLIAFHGKQETKDFYIARIRAHRLADELIHGTGWENGKGCAVGCTLHKYDHAAYEVELGIPRILARLEDGIFESLSNGKSQEWPERFLGAIQPSADLSMVWPQFAVWMLADPKHGVLQFAKKKKPRKAIQDIADKYVEWAATGINPLEYEGWNKLRVDASASAAAFADASASAAASAAAFAAADAAAAAFAAADAAAAAFAAADAAADAAAARKEWREDRKSVV